MTRMSFFGSKGEIWWRTIMSSGNGYRGRMGVKGIPNSKEGNGVLVEVSSLIVLRYSSLAARQSNLHRADREAVHTEHELQPERSK